jgi:hypothetical protein
MLASLFFQTALRSLRVQIGSSLEPVAMPWAPKSSRRQCSPSTEELERLRGCDSASCARGVLVWSTTSRVVDSGLFRRMTGTGAAWLQTAPCLRCAHAVHFQVSSFAVSHFHTAPLPLLLQGGGGL